MYVYIFYIYLLYTTFFVRLQLGHVSTLHAPTCTTPQFLHVSQSGIELKC